MSKNTTLTIGSDNFISQAKAWTREQKEAAKTLTKQVKSKGIKTIRIVYSDQHGIMRGKSVTAENFPLVLKNGMNEATGAFGKDTANIPVFPLFNADGGFGVDEMGGAGDLVLVPDPLVFKILPWAPDTAWMMADVYLKNGTPCPFDTRHVLRQSVKKLKSSGYAMTIGLELEFYIFNIDDAHLSLEDSGQSPTPPAVSAVHHGFQYHAEDRLDAMGPFTDQIHDVAMELDLSIRTIEVEWGPGQVEVTFNPMDAMDAADSILMFRSAMKHYFRRQGKLVSFMAKPGLPNLYSSGWHLHQSLKNVKTGNNSFLARGKNKPVSETCLHYIGGLLANAEAATVFSNPTINGYKRINANPLAPNRITWAYDNRGVMIRLIGGYGDPATRLENRSGEPCANPYLYIASQVYAGLAGIQNKLDPGEPVIGNPYEKMDKPPMPASLMEAVAHLDSSKQLRKDFSDQFIDYFLTFKRAEIGRFLSHVTDWEHREYFEMF